MNLAPGTRLGPYELRDALGAGAMGQVFRARDSRLERDVAIKVLPPEFAADRERLARFDREARLLAQLSHPHIAALYDIAQEGALCFLVLELVPGRDLAALLARGRLGVREALRIASQIASGMAAAHDRGVIHRDLKPANVRVQPDDMVKVLDFGLATGGDAAQESESALTRPGAVFGTVPYMSPEQARGLPVDRRSDVWAFGCVLYEMLTGRRAMPGNAASEIFAAILEREPDWVALPAGLPPRVTELVQRCLAKDRETRLRDLGDARLELERALIELSSGAHAPAVLAPRRRATGVRAAQLAGALVVGALLTRSLWTGPGADAPAAPARRVYLTTPLPTVEAGASTLLTLSPDGSALAWFQLVPPADFSLNLRPLDALAAQPLVAGGWTLEPCFSPDGRNLAYTQEGRLYKVGVAGAARELLADGVGQLKGIAWMEDGIVFAPTASSGLLRVPAGGGPLETLTVPDRARGELSHRWPAPLPGGRHLLFNVKTRGLASFDDAPIALLDLADGTWTTLIAGGMRPTWVPSGHILYARQGGLMAVPFDAAGLRLTGAPVRVLDDLRTEPLSGTAQYAVSTGAGTLAYLPGPNVGEVNRPGWLDLFSGTFEPFDLPPGPYVGGLALAPDGRQLVVAVQGASDYLELHDLARGTARRLTFDGNCSRPRWTGDGRHVIYASDRSGPLRMWKLALDGSEDVEAPDFERVGEQGMVRTPDGDVIAWFEPEGDGGVLRLRRLDGADPGSSVLRLASPHAFVALAPDARHIAYSSAENGLQQVFVTTAAGVGRWPISTSGGIRPRWSAKGERLFWMAPTAAGDNPTMDDEMWTCTVRFEPDFEAGPPQRLVDVRDYSLGPTGPDDRVLAVHQTPQGQMATPIVGVFHWLDELRRLAPPD